jgi:hypothetical protein
VKLLRFEQADGSVTRTSRVGLCTLSDHMKIQIETNHGASQRESAGSEQHLEGRDDRKVRALCIATMLMMLIALPSCARVAAHQRGRLAHPTMVSGVMSSKAGGHVYAIGEGAMGGQVGASAGCGCN